jgi:hypothetical protein
VAKELVIEVRVMLKTILYEGTVNELGSLLGMCFAYPTVQAPIRSLAYFYLHTDNTMDNILWQLEWQRHYFFSGDGKVILHLVECIECISIACCFIKKCTELCMNFLSCRNGLKPRSRICSCGGLELMISRQYFTP